MSRESMINNVVKKFGADDKRTVWFTQVCEQYPSGRLAQTALEIGYAALLNEEI